MAQHGSPGFQSYSRNLRRLLWVEFIDAQMVAADKARNKALFVEDARQGRKGPAVNIEPRCFALVSGLD